MSDRFDRLHPKKLNFARGPLKTEDGRVEPIMSWVMDGRARHDELPTNVYSRDFATGGRRREYKKNRWVKRGVKLR